MNFFFLFLYLCQGKFQTFIVFPRECTSVSLFQYIIWRKYNKCVYIQSQLILFTQFSRILHSTMNHVFERLTGCFRWFSTPLPATACFWKKKKKLDLTYIYIYIIQNRESIKSDLKQFPYIYSVCCFFSLFFFFFLKYIIARVKPSIMLRIEISFEKVLMNVRIRHWFSVYTTILYLKKKKHYCDWYNFQKLYLCDFFLKERLVCDYK